MQHQPVPDVTPDDVERILRRDYSGAQFNSASDVLNMYAQSPSGRRELVRAQLAALKLANGDLDALRTHIDTANEDFRDVVGPAEYPEYQRCRFNPEHSQSPKEKEKVLDRDWKQYQDWLRR